MKFNQGNTKGSKLTAVEVLAIREKYASRVYTQADLSREYRVSINTVRNIVNGTTWQQVPSVTPEDVIEDEALRSLREFTNSALPPAAIDLPPDLAERLSGQLASVPEFERLPPAIADRFAAYTGRRPSEGGDRPVINPEVIKDEHAATERSEQALSRPAGGGDGTPGG